MERKLASIQTIGKLEKIENADRILKATVLGWTLVVRVDEFQEGDKCIFFEIDSCLKEGPEWCEFMRPRKFHVKTIKLKNTLSQGLALPCSILPGSEEFSIDTDVTELLGVTKYEPPLCNGGASMGQAAGNFPYFVNKTDEIRLQSKPELVEELKLAGPFYISVKVDGASGTFCYDGDEFCACSRNLKKKEDEVNIYWAVARKYDLKEILLNTSLAIQGEIAGPKLQKNKLRLSEPDLFVFDIFDYRDMKYFGLKELQEFCKINELKTVPIEKIIKDFSDFDYSLEAWLKRAEGFYDSKLPREGIVVRPVEFVYSPVLQSRLSFKVINNEYLLKGGD